MSAISSLKPIVVQSVEKAGRKERPGLLPYFEDAFYRKRQSILSRHETRAGIFLEKLAADSRDRARQADIYRFHAPSDSSVSNIINYRSHVHCPHLLSAFKVQKIYNSLSFQSVSPQIPVQSLRNLK